ncbi:hypothetical protein [uncultured Pseudokineococcus sp.]|uniref:hypothetical protein n=1 Tax=uncultured Pseudokineococcus sp. TaxID=1642928 RepID=UPI002613DA84|nr:hypothetical protein [uncultured Pseudokineococcus sp.]
MTVARPDREDVSAQEEALAGARAALASAVEHLAAVSRTEARGRADDRLDAVAAEADALRRTLRSRARRPPAPDTAPLAGAVSSAERRAARSDEWDDAVRAVRGAEADLDVAAVDLAAARGEDV